MTPTQVNAAIRSAYKASPDGGLTGVSAPLDKSSALGGPLSRIKDFASGFLRSAQDALVDKVNLANILVPGGAAAARVGAEAAKKAAGAADKAAGAAARVAGSASDGVRSGFKLATAVIVLIVGLWAWSVAKPKG